MKEDKSPGFSTRAIHTGEKPDFREGACGDVVKPIHLSTTYARAEIDKPTSGYEYSRSSNPTRDALEKKLASIENAEYGLAFASGLAAAATIIHATLKHEDHIIAFDDLYGGTKRLIKNVFPYVHITFVDAVRTGEVEKAIRENTRLIWLESPTNPLLKVCDIKGISEIARKHGILLVVDNTFLSPYFQNPLDLGANIVYHSSTKYLGGHSDVIGGSVMVSDVGLYEKLKYYQNAIGAVPSPFDCYLTMRGIKTLALRMEKHNSNALKIARFLESHPRVEKVIYPGLKSHPQYELSSKQSRGSGGMITFVLKGNISEAKKFVQDLHVFALAESLGGVESLIGLPSLMTHASVPKEEREKLGITDTLIRMSVGIEDADDLMYDLDQALMK